MSKLGKSRVKHKLRSKSIDKNELIPLIRPQHNIDRLSIDCPRTKRSLHGIFNCNKNIFTNLMIIETLAQPIKYNFDFHKSIKTAFVSI